VVRRVRLLVALWSTITGWYISFACLVTILITAARIDNSAAVQHQHVWSQSFYYGIYAAVLYVVCASLMVVTLLAVRRQPRVGTTSLDLTASQRTLMLQTILYLVYVLVGALIFSRVEGWSCLDAVYWAQATLYTIGFGDFAPNTNLGRALLLPYAFAGILSVSLVVGSIWRFVLEDAKVYSGQHVADGVRRAMKRKGRKASASSTTAPLSSDISTSKDEFDATRACRDRIIRKRKWTAVTTSLVVWLSLWFLGAAIFLRCETHQE
jgi:potassium channel subfamily K